MKSGMTKILWIGAGVALIAVGIGAGYWWAHRSMSSTASMTRADPSPEKGRILYWHDPMVPNVKFDKPGKSPFMDMQLVPVYAEDEEGTGVRVSAAIAQNLGIRLGEVERIEFQERFRAVGDVAFDEQLLELVQARVEGYVTHLHVKSPLELVKKGQPLAEILAPEWLEAQQEYLSLLEADAGRARALRDAARQRLVVLGVPESAIVQVERTRRANANTTLFAPIDGVVTQLGARQGAAFVPGETLFRINGLSTVWVNAQIPEAKVSAVAAGTAVHARATGWPGASFPGKVIALLPDVDAKTRTLTARVSLQNEDRKLSPGMFVTLDFFGPAQSRLVVPSEAIIPTGERDVVIVRGDDGSFNVAQVTIGPDQGGRTVILSGLTQGQSVVRSGQFLIDSEASLRSTVNRLESTAEPPR